MPGFCPRFFVPLESVPRGGLSGSATSADLSGAELTLTIEDSHHAVRVLRLVEGDGCEVVVGAAGTTGAAWTTGAAVYAASVSAAADPVRVRLVARLEGPHAGAEYRVQVGLVQALTRPSLIDFVIEKGTEVGASFFLLVQAVGSPARSGLTRSDRLERWRRIAREAAKQSKQVAVPPVDVAGSVDGALRDLQAAGALSLALEPRASESLHELLGRQSARPERVALWVGPEGGWAPAESACFSTAGIEGARLGRSVLRTETAGHVAVAVARLALGDW